VAAKGLVLVGWSIVLEKKKQQLAKHIPQNKHQKRGGHLNE
jgi:hypothetical protein